MSACVNHKKLRITNDIPISRQTKDRINTCLQQEIAKKKNFQIINNNDKCFLQSFLKTDYSIKNVKVHRQAKQIMQNVLTKGWLPVALFLMQTILLKIVDVSEFMDPALLMMGLMPVTRL